MSTLVRTEASGFLLSQAHTLGQIEALSAEQRETIIYPVEYIFRDMPKIRLPEFFARLAKSGLEIYLKKIGLSAACGDRFAIYDSEGIFFAVGEVREFDGGLAVKPIRQF